MNFQAQNDWIVAKKAEMVSQTASGIVLANVLRDDIYEVVSSSQIRYEAGMKLIVSNIERTFEIDGKTYHAVKAENIVVVLN